MEVRLSLALPREGVSVPVARRLLAHSLDLLGVEQGVTGDIQLALSEACTNVLNHSAEDDDYGVTVAILGSRCVLEVVDHGHGFDGSRQGHAQAAADAEQGRGIQLMRALVDQVEFVSRPHRGTVVHLEKQLSWRDGSLGQRWEEQQARL